MLKLYDTNRKFVEYLRTYQDLCIEGDLSTGDSTLSFQYLGKSPHLVNEAYIRTEDAWYVIKELHPGEDSTSCECELDLEDLEAGVFDKFTAENCTILEAASAALAGTGWQARTTIEKRRSVQTFRARPRQLIEKIRDAFMCEIRYDNVNKIVEFAEEFGSYKGVYLRRELNLKKLSTTIDSRDYYTRIQPIGKDGLTITSVNDGLPYVENYQYTDKVKTYVWEDNSYEDAETLREDAELKLWDMSKPKRSYQADIIDLARLSDQYELLSFDLGDAVDLVDEPAGIMDRQRIVRIKRYPEEPERNSCELSNTVLTFEELQDRLDKAAAAWEEATNTDGSIKGVYVHGVEADGIVGIDVVVNSAVDNSTVFQEVKTTAQSALTKAGAAETASALAVNQVNAIYERVGTLEATYLKATDAQLIYAQIADLTAVQADIHDLSVDYGAFKTLTASELAAAKADIEDLQVHALTVDQADAKYLTAVQGDIRYLNTRMANIDLANIDRASVNSLYAATGLIRSVTISEGHVVDFLDAVQVDAASITVGTLVADRILIRGSEDGLIYALNAVSGAQQDQNVNTLNGEVLTPRTVTADRIVAQSITGNEIAANAVTAFQIDVDNLFAQDIEATGTIRGVTLEGAKGIIGGWNMLERCLYAESSYSGAQITTVFQNTEIAYAYTARLTDQNTFIVEQWYDAMDRVKFHVTGLKNGYRVVIAGDYPHGDATLDSQTEAGSLLNGRYQYYGQAAFHVGTWYYNAQDNLYYNPVDDMYYNPVTEMYATQEEGPYDQDWYYIEHGQEATEVLAGLPEGAQLTVGDAPACVEFTITTSAIVDDICEVFTLNLPSAAAGEMYTFHVNIYDDQGNLQSIDSVDHAEVNVDEEQKYSELIEGLPETAVLAIKRTEENGDINILWYVDKAGDMAAQHIYEGGTALETKYVKSTELLNKIYPIGSIYMSVTNTDPATLLGGTWERLKDRFLLGAGDAYTGGDTGGAATHTLTVDQIPSHNHTYDRSNDNTGSTTLTAAQSGVPAHGHGFTQPTVNGGSCNIGSSGGHTHTISAKYTEAVLAKGSALGRYNQKGNNTSTTMATIAANTGAHTHTVPGHTHSVSGGAVSNNSAANASQGHTHTQPKTSTNSGAKGGGAAHNNMPPYLVVHMWKRTA